MRQGRRRVLYVAPAGSGKRLVACRTIAAATANGKAQEDTTIMTNSERETRAFCAVSDFSEDADLEEAARHIGNMIVLLSGMVLGLLILGVSGITWAVAWWLM